ncbi:MAG: homoserine dehydrogenase [Candidatus Helarchaeales archaeon]
MVNIALVGFGTVGRALAGAMHKKQEYIKQEFGIDLKIIAIFELEGAFINPDGLKLDELLEYSFKEFKKHPDWEDGATVDSKIGSIPIDILVEVSYTNPETGEPAYSYMKAALTHGCHVVTSNKGPIALYYNELHELAARNNVDIRYESTVGSGIPIINMGLEGLRGNKIESITAILNGTSNFILSKMNEEKVPFEIALKNAQELGYAEADPTLDIEGHDAAFKLLILANTFLKKKYTVKDLSIKGIKDITLEAMELAREDDLIIKHIAIATEDGKLEVAPCLVPINSPFAIGGTNNIIILKTDLAQEISIIGHGAGGQEAASGLLGDIISIALKRGL